MGPMFFIELIKEAVQFSTTPSTFKIGTHRSIDLS